MKKLLITLIIVIAIFAQDGKYYRKSITSLGEVLFAQQPDQELKDMLYNRIKQHIEIERFDFNTLPKDVLEDFQAAVRNTKYAPDEIIGVINQTVMPYLKMELDKVKEIRADKNLTEEQKARAIVDKMKSSGATDKDILAVYNAAYIYLPVITSYSEKEENGNYTFTISGFIIWFKVNTKDATNFSIDLVSKDIVPFIGMETAKIGEKYPIKNKSLEAKQYAKLMACNILVRNWAVDMKKIPEFSLAGEIKNVDSYLEVAIGKKEGVGLDDGYDVVDVFENESGEIVKKNIGFVRAEKIGDNTKEGVYDPSLFKPYISGNFERGQFLSERPNLGIDVGLRPKYFGLKISKDDLPFLSDDIKSAFGLDLLFSYNLAKITGVTQNFVNLEINGGLFGADVNNHYDVSNMFTYSAYLSFSKKFWVKRLNVELGAGYGYNVLSFKISNNFANLEDTYSLKAYGLKIDASLNYLVNPELQVGAYIGYKITSNIAEAEIKDKNGNKSTYAILDSKTNFSGLAIGLHFSYTVPSMPFDPFSSLSAQSIEY